MSLAPFRSIGKRRYYGSQWMLVDLPVPRSIHSEVNETSRRSPLEQATYDEIEFAKKKPRRLAVGWGGGGGRRGRPGEDN